MNVDSKKTEGKNTFFFLSVVACAVIAGWYATACGLLLTSDSFQYLSSAESFANDFTFLSPDGSYFTHWPPLFSIILSVIGPSVAAVRWLHVVAFAGVAFTLWNLSPLFFKTPLARNIFLLLSLLNVQMIMIYSFVWSELLFMAFALLNFYCIANLHRQRAFFWGALLTGMLMCLQRNAGLFWITGTCGWLMLFYEAPLRQRIVKTIALFLVSTTGLWAWNIYNSFFVPADFVFYDHRFFDGLLSNMVLAGKSFAGILIPASRYPFLSAIFLLVISIGILVLWRQLEGSMKLALCVLIVYTGCFMCLGPLDGFEIDRYFSVVVPLALAVFLMLVEHALRIVPGSWRLVGMALVVLWSLFPMARTINNLERWHQRSCSQEKPASFYR